MTAPQPTIRRLGPDDASAFRALRMTALTTEPSAFASSPEEETALSLDVLRERLSPARPNATFGALAVDELVGIAGFVVNEKMKQRHKGSLVGVFVQPAWQRRGVGTALVRAVIAHAATHVSILQAHVTMSNAYARAMYRALGFRPFGVEPKALLVDGVFHDEELIMLELPRPR